MHNLPPACEKVAQDAVCIIHDASGGNVSWATAVAAGAATLAALASWRNVILTQRTWRLSLLPDLVVTIVEQEAGGLELRVDNAGGGPARYASYALLSNGELLEGEIGKVGYLAAGKGFSRRFEIVSTGSSQGAVFAQDSFGTHHAWALDGTHETFGRRPWWMRPFPRAGRQAHGHIYSRLVRSASVDQTGVE